MNSVPSKMRNLVGQVCNNFSRIGKFLSFFRISAIRVQNWATAAFMSIDLIVDLSVDLIVDLSLDWSVDLSVDLILDLSVDLSVDMSVDLINRVTNDFEQRISEFAKKLDLS